MLPIIAESELKAIGVPKAERAILRALAYHHLLCAPPGLDCAYGDSFPLSEHLMPALRVWPGVFVALVLTLPVRGDDTADFLNPANWEGLKGLWTIESDRIIGETMVDPKHNTFLCSKQSYGDFELSFKIQLRDGVGNSGVQIRSQVVDREKFIVAGPQADIGAKYWGSLYGEKFGADGSLPGKGHMMQAAPADKVTAHVKPDGWNDYTIRCVGKHVTITINGQIMVDDEFSKIPDQGIIAFQIHSGYPKMRVEFKDVKFTRLPAK